jgi:hypothetical protein
MKNAIISWLESGRDYNEGVDLYFKYGRNPNFKKMFPHRENRYATKLAYELAKLAGISLSEFQTKFQKRVLKPTVNKPRTETPAIIKKIKSELGDLHRLRAHLHRKMSEVPEDNTPENMKSRAALLENIKKISERADILWNAKEHYYETGQLPPASTIEPPKKDKKANEMTGEDRVKRRSNLRSSLSKDKKKAEETPDGPKKDKILIRIKAKEKEIKELTALIDKD